MRRKKGTKASSARFSSTAVSNQVPLIALQASMVIPLSVDDRRKDATTITATADPESVICVGYTNSNTLDEILSTSLTTGTLDKAFSPLYQSFSYTVRIYHCCNEIAVATYTSAQQLVSSLCCIK